MKYKQFFVTVLAVFLSSALCSCDEDKNSTDSSANLLPPQVAADGFGEFGVGHTSYTAVDAAREERRLKVDVWYPTDLADTSGRLTAYPLAPLIDLTSEVAREGITPHSAGPHTLLVFSHGYGAINTQSIELMEILASHGFVVASLEHTGNAQPSDHQDSFDDAAANRVPDVRHVIDSMTARSADSEDLLFGSLDPNNVGVIGHSFGGMTAVGIAAGWAGAQPDSRVQAIVPISAVIQSDLQSAERNSDNAGFSAEALASIEIPALLMGGTEDFDVEIENNQIAFDDMTGSPAVYKVDVVGANHTHFANVCTLGNLLIELGIGQDAWEGLGAGQLIEPYNDTCGPDALPFEEAIRLSALYSVAFFRHHLRGESAYSYYLTDDYAAMEANIGFSHRP